MGTIRSNFQNCKEYPKHVNKVFDIPLSTKCSIDFKEIKCQSLSDHLSSQSFSVTMPESELLIECFCQAMSMSLGTGF